MPIFPQTFIKPGFLTTHVFNPAVVFLVARLGISVKGARVLSVRGRKTGAWHSTPVNPLSFRGQRYLVSPRGETQWVRNLRAYLEAWAWEVSRFFAGVGADAPDEVFARIAAQHPVFRIVSP